MNVIQDKTDLPDERERAPHDGVYPDHTDVDRRVFAGDRLPPGITAGDVREIDDAPKRPADEQGKRRAAPEQDKARRGPAETKGA